jgi:tryptophan-rich sensory protein
MRIHYLRLVVCLVICQLAGIIGSIFTTPAIPDWYASLEKPSFSPPNWLFAPVWTFLFLLMGITLYMIWQAYPKKQAKSALLFFLIQLGLNILWSVIFFGLKSPLIAFVEIVILWLAILLTMIKTFEVSKVAGYLLVPYILWVNFAAVLNYFLWRLNP